jgi:hypothetical protein
MRVGIRQPLTAAAHRLRHLSGRLTYLSNRQSNEQLGNHPDYRIRLIAALQFISAIVIIDPLLPVTDDCLQCAHRMPSGHLSRRTAS